MDWFVLSFAVGTGVMALAFAAELVDSSLGMGYGTTLTPILLIMGFEPLQVIPAILLSELITGVLAGFTHHRMGNVDFRPKTMHIGKIFRALRQFGLAESARKGLPLALRVALVLSLCSIIGTIAAVFIAVSIPSEYLKIYIGVLIFVVGFAVILTLHSSFRFSWLKIGILGIIASFNKGMSGGGYRPVVTSGQLVSGVNEKNAVAITSLSEGLTCLVGVITYVGIEMGGFFRAAGSASGGGVEGTGPAGADSASGVDAAVAAGVDTAGALIDWQLAPYLVIGAMLSVIPSAVIVKNFRPKDFKLTIGALTMGLGIWTLSKVML